MHVFVTGASGWIGSAVLPELVAAGHTVTGLARSEAAAATVERLGATAVRGDLEDLDVLRAAAAGSDGVVHLAFRHDLVYSGQFEAAATADRAAIEAIGDALAGSDRPFVIASGLLFIAPGRTVTEADMPDLGDAAHAGMRIRGASALHTLELAGRGVRSSVLRLPPTVHGEGDNGFLPTIIGADRAAGVAGYVGDGANRWPAVHVADAARLFRLALEGAPAGSVLHAVADEGVAIRDLATVISRHLGIPAGPVPPEQFGPLAGFVGLDTPASAAATRALLDWKPEQPGLLEDLDAGHYFRLPPA